MTVYETFNNDYLVYADETYEMVVEQVISSIECRGDVINVLELGCGSGAFSRFFVKDPRIRLVGVDISESLIDLARQIVTAENAEFICAAIDLSYVDKLGIEQFDIVFSGAFLHHLLSLERVALLKLFNNKIRIGGVFAFFEPNRHNPAIAFQYHFETRLNLTQYDRDEFPLYLKDIGKELSNSSGVTVRYMDVTYRPLANSRPLVSRFGLIGSLCHKALGRVFGYYYRFIKSGWFSDRRCRDYFIAIFKF